MRLNRDHRSCSLQANKLYLQNVHSPDHPIRIFRDPAPQFMSYTAMGNSLFNHLSQIRHEIKKFSMSSEDFQFLSVMGSHASIGSLLNVVINADDPNASTLKS